jgi:hypothetical protein
MVRTSRTLLILVFVGVLTCSLSGLALSQEKPELSGSLTATATSVAVGVGWSWGKGTLTLLDGSEYPFKLSGLDVIAAGMSQTSIVGKVYNLKNVEDFSGTYTAVKAGITVGGGAGAATMSNQNGVIINVTGTASGVKVNLAVSGMKITLVK